MRVGNALKLACVGFGLGVLLRVVQMLYFFDYDTGFYTDGGVMAWLSLGVPLAAAVAGGVLCFRSRRYFGPYVPRRNVLVGVVGLLSAAALLCSAALQFLGRGSNPSDLSYTGYNAATHQVIHTGFWVGCVLFGLVQLVVSVGFFTGKNTLEKAPLLYLTGVFWGLCYLVLVYVFYARSASFVENFFSVISAAALVLALFYLCKLFAGVDEEGAAKRLFVTGILAVVLTLTYTVPNLALLLLDRSYPGEIPPAIQLASLGVAAFLLLFLVTFRKYSLRRTPKGGTERPVPRHGARSQMGEGPAGPSPL